MRRIVQIFTALFFWSGAVVASDEIQLMTEEFAPYQFYEESGEEKVLTGISVEIVQALQKQVGNTSKLKVLPWSRGLKLLDNKKNVALFSTARTPARESKYKWVGPLADLNIVFFKKAGSQIDIKTLEEAKSVPKIGVTKNVASQEVLKNMGFKNLDVVTSGSDDRNIKRLIKGRVDLWPTAYFAGIYSARKLGLLDQIEAIPQVNIMSGHLYIAFNKETDDKIIHNWQAGLDQLRSEGKIADIIAKYDR